MHDRSLESIQRFVVEALRRPDPVALDPATTAGAESMLLPSPRGLSPSDRLEIYREQFWLRHESNLLDDFPTLAWVLGGPDALRRWTRQYLGAFPPRTWDLQRLGASVPTFVASDPSRADDSLALDASRLDWAFMEAFDAPDASPFDPTVLAGIDEARFPLLRVELHPSIRLLALDHPLHRVRESLKRGETVARPPAARTFLVIWRDRGCHPRCTEIASLAFRLLSALGAGQALGQACEEAASNAAAQLEELDTQLATWFAQWTSDGWVTSVRFEG
jgi:hypothetical protein